MEDFNFAALPHPVGEAEIMWFRRTLHFEVLRAVKGVFCLISDNPQPVAHALSQLSWKMEFLT
jgi:hypothetical protein